MRLLVTGVSGFVGSRLYRHLVELGDEVVGTYCGARPEMAEAELHEVDVLDRAATLRLFAATEPDAVVHLAGLSHVGESWRRMPDYFRVNVLGTEHVLEAAAGLPVVLASSAEVYGYVPEEEQPLEEERPAGPGSPYALTKAAAERLALGRGAVVVRSFNLLGAGQAPDFALPSFALQLARMEAGRTEPVLRVGNLEARRDFLHVDDAAAAYRRLVDAGQPGGVYNLGSGKAWSIRQVLARLLEISGVEARIEVDPERLRPVDLPLLRADTRRLEALGWRPGAGLDAALADLWADARRRVAGEEDGAG